MGVERDKTIDELLEAREAYERRDWAVALDRLRGMGSLGPDDTFALATSAYLLGDVDEAVRALQSGYQDRIRNEDSLGAARFASWLGLLLNVRGSSRLEAVGSRERSGCSRLSPKTSSSVGTFLRTNSSSTSAAGILPERARRPLASSRPVAASPNQTWSLKA